MCAARRTLCVTIAAVAVLGCGRTDTPPLGRVKGTVKLDGDPLSNARVEFHPKEGGRPSVGTTDDSGRYDLEYKPGVRGALVGTHRVQIRTYREGDPDSDDESRRATVPEKVPAEYNANTTLEKEVSSGKNDSIDFDLKSGGRIVKPGAEDPRPRRQSNDCS